MATKTSIACVQSQNGTHQRRPQYTPNNIPDPSYVRILDTTLRDGEQAPGAAMTSQQKLELARQLPKLRVDIIEAGFPSASKDDFLAVKLIAQEIGNGDYGDDGYVPVIAGVCRCNEKDIATAWEAVKYAKRPRLSTFISTSPIHMEYKLKKTKDEVLEIASKMVKFARSLGCNDIQFVAEDAARSDREFLYQIFGEVIKAGATTVDIPDTVGIMMPWEYGRLIADIKANTPGIENVIIATHCHNDLGVATANTLEGARAGARQLEVTINGIGERAGNAALEEVVMALKYRGNVFGGLYTGISTKHILKTSKMVEEFSSLHLQPHKALVGANAFVHESGIHQDGMIKHRSTYQIISPEDIGLEKSTQVGIVLGKLSGRQALRKRLQELGYELKDEEVENLFWHFKAIAEKKKRVTDADLRALISEDVYQAEPVWKLGDLQVTCGTLDLSTATVKLVANDGSTHVACSVGTGPVDSAYKAVNLIVKEPVKLLEYSTISDTERIGSIATTRVVICKDNNSKCSSAACNGESVHPTFSGTGAKMDVVVSSVEAYIAALNKMLGSK
ncbi:hypothetical protein RIF29_41998 [Crotalaria pallida]|uniref:2-isopropylmalate synthase n=1 Tax=Crotalaria pallida TaxID=3830 RepID=A0AAN9E7D8_CROPI